MVGEPSLELRVVPVVPCGDWVHDRVSMFQLMQRVSIMIFKCSPSLVNSPALADCAQAASMHSDSAETRMVGVGAISCAD